MGLAYVWWYLFQSQYHQKIRERDAQGFYLLFPSNLATLQLCLYIQKKYIT